MVLTKESNSIKGLINQLNSQFIEVVNLILNSKGKVIITGIGKSAIVSMKISSTLNSTGTSSVFLHAADAMHGDLGLVNPNDLVVIISNSGSSNEIKDLVPHLKKRGNVIISITGGLDSFLAKESDYLLSCFVEEEACPNNLAPTNSTTAQLVIGDAIAVTLVKIKGFTKNDFAKFHPGGNLGKKLLLKVKDLVEPSLMPSNKTNDSINEVIIEISEKMLGITAVLNDEKIVGVITDGDLRRTLLNHKEIKNLTAQDIMSVKPQIIDHESLAVEALELMRKHKISQLVTTKNDKYHGIIHIQSLIKEGIAS